MEMDASAPPSGVQPCKTEVFPSVMPSFTGRFHLSGTLFQSLCYLFWL